MISKADLIKDKGAIIGLWDENFPGLPKKRYEWIYENNPAGIPSCWLARKNESVIGSATVFPRRLFINGQSVAGGITGDFSVVKKFRLLGPAVALQKEIISNYIKEGFDLIYTLPNEKSVTVATRSGYSVIGDVVSLTRPLRSQSYLKERIHFPIIPELLQKPIDLAITTFTKENFFKEHKECTFEVLSQFDSRFDTLWKKILHNFIIIGERTSSYLNWRFVKSPHESYSIFIIKQVSNQEILGYIVFNTVNNRVKIADILSIDDKTLDILLSEFILFSRREDIDSISIRIAGGIDMTRKLHGYGFSVRDTEGKLLGLFPQDSLFSREVRDINNWYIMAGDNDI